jgi:hypothetical protein
MFNDATTIYADCVSNACSIGKVEFSHCSRDVNVVAHEGRSQQGASWGHDPPHCRKSCDTSLLIC